MPRWPTWARALVIVLASACVPAMAATAPGFVEEPVGSGWDAVVGVTFDQAGNLYGWEKAGRVWIVHPDGTKHPTPLIDLHEEVGNWTDHGMLGFALDPNFLANGYIYLFYVVDRHHLLHFGTPGYDPATDEYFAATIARITRYTAIAADNFESVDPASRLVLVGETKSTGFPITYQSHGVGTLVFGTDGMLLASCGDGASYNAVDNGGSDGGSYAPQALADGIIDARQDVGAFRAQLLDSLSGKILRLDPATGDGVPSNPFYSAGAPRSARSRIWAFGLRNPFRMTVRPGTGEHDPVAGNPGAIYVGDVGYEAWEDIDVVTGPAQNFGWPIFEGMTLQAGYFAAKTANQSAPNPLFGSGGCTKQYFDFQELVVQDDLSPSWPNPCNASQQVPAAFRSLHRRPAIDYAHGSGPARTAAYDGAGHATTLSIGSGSPVVGDGFGGNTSTGGVFYTGTAYPGEYTGKYFHGDWGSNWIRYFTFDAAQTPQAVARFIDTGRHPVAFAIDPLSGDVFYVDYGFQVFRLRYLSDRDKPPTAIVAAERTYGPRPLQVRFFGDGSTDPEGGPLSYLWTFGDGATSTLQNPIHTFTPAGPGPAGYAVQLVVADALGQTSSTSLQVVTDDTPPSVALTSPLDGSTYSTSDNAPLVVSSDVSDAQDPPNALACLTQVSLHHSDHVHAEPEVYACGTSTVTTPLGCNGVLYYYRAHVSVTDTSGLTAGADANVYPACAGSTLVAHAGPDIVVTDQERDGSSLVMLDGSASMDPVHPIASYHWHVDGAPFAQGATALHAFPVGTTRVTLVVANDVNAFAVDTLLVTVLPGSGAKAVPEARFAMTPESGLPPFVVAFDGSQSSDPDGSVAAWFWSFGDGSFASGPTASHTYASPGTYAASLTVTDDDGLQDTEVHTVRAEDARIVAWLSLEEYAGIAAPDGSGLRNDGALKGGATWSLGAVGNAVSLDGADDRIEILPAISLDLRTRLTLAAWIHLDTAGSGDGILVRGQTQVPYGLALEADGRLRFLANAGNPVGGGGGGVWTSTGAIPVGSWHHVAVTYDGAWVRFYIDGALDRVQPVTGLVFGRVLEPLFVGANLRDGAYLDGDVDDVRVYDWALPSATLAELGSGENGLTYQYYEGIWGTLPNFDALPVLEAGAVPNVTLTVRNREDYFGVRFRGCLDVPAPGSYTFFTTSDDGSKLYVDGVQVVDNDGVHGPRERSGTRTLTAGLHPYTVTFFEGDIGEMLETRWQGPGIAKQTISDGAVFRTGCSAGTNRRPVAVADALQVAVGGQGQVAVLANDSDPDGPLPQLVSVQSALHGTVTRVGSNVTYVHDGSANLVDAFEYKITDGFGATARGTVQVRICASSDATCDGVDDDCDGSIDENGGVPGRATRWSGPRRPPPARSPTT
jgi:PKD repeat protein/glucose/arabinose dehydrogenase